MRQDGKSRMVSPSLALGLWIGALSLAPSARGAESITNISLSPASPAPLLHDEYVYVTFDYATTEPGGVFIFARPFTNGAPTPDYAAHPSPLHPAGNGTYTGFFKIRSGDLVVDQIRFRMYNSDQSVLLLHTSVPVQYHYGNSITNIRLSPASPAALLHDEHVYITFDYATTEAGGVSISATAFTNGAPTPDCVAHGSRRHPAGKHSNAASFAIASGDVVVDHVRFQMYGPDQSILLFETFVPVEYGFGNSITNVAISPSSPEALHHDEYVSVAFDYATTEPGGVRILARPFTNGAPTPNCAVDPSPVYPAAKGSDTGFFTITSGNVVVDQIKFQMYDASQSVLLLETSVRVEYHFGTSITHVALSPLSPAALLTDEYVNITFDYATTEPGGVRIFAAPFTNGTPSLPFPARPSPLHPTGKGSGTGFFAAPSWNVVVDQIKFQMYNSDTSALLLEFSVPVEFHCGNSITNVSLSPPSPAALSHREYVYVAFDYATSEPGGVRIFARPLVDGSSSIRSLTHPSPLHPQGRGSEEGYFTITSGDVVVDQIRFRMYNSDQSVLLLETFMPVEYHFGDLPVDEGR